MLFIASVTCFWIRRRACKMYALATFGGQPQSKYQLWTLAYWCLGSVVKAILILETHKPVCAPHVSTSPRIPDPHFSNQVSSGNAVFQWNSALQVCEMDSYSLGQFWETSTILFQSCLEMPRRWHTKSSPPHVGYVASLLVNLEKRFAGVHETQASRDSIAVVSIGKRLVYHPQASMPFKYAFGQENIRKKYCFFLRFWNSLMAWNYNAMHIITIGT